MRFARAHKAADNHDIGPLLNFARIRLVELRAVLYSPIIHASSLFLDSQISTPGRLIFVTHRDDIPAIPARRGRQPVTLVGGVEAAPEGSA